MLLKSIELQGYKTFAGRTLFEFDDAITCIVGPNGSGKSNIADAMRWVLGEQSFRLLRGKKTEDMIFSGSEARPRAGMASVSILFDNASGWLPIDFSEVVINRRAYRDGSNEYLLNGQRVRLRDIMELLGNSGLSERTYTIIGQGLVDAALALRAEERRALFEEAAGIGLYRSRREEAQRRLETTHRNLERVEDILAELKPRLRSLERQARRAIEYDQVKADLQVLLRDWYGFHWYRAQRELTEARESAHVNEMALEAVRQEQFDLDQKLATLRDRIQGLRARAGSWHRELAQLHNQRQSITRELAVADERSLSLATQQQNTSEELARLEQQTALLQERLHATDREVEQLAAELQEARAEVESAQAALKVRQAERQRVEQMVSEARRKLADLQNQQTRWQAQWTERQATLEKQRLALAAAGQAVTVADKEAGEAENRLLTLEKALQQAVAGRTQAEQTLAEHRKQLAEVESQRQEATQQRAHFQAELARVKAQAEVLEQAEKALAGYASGARLLLGAAQKERLSGVESALSSQLEVPEQLEMAIAAALGEYLDAVVLKDGLLSDGALELLLAESTRGVLLPLDALIPAQLQPLSGRAAQQPGVIGLAAELVGAPSRLRPAVDLLLGQTWVVQDRQTARQLLTGQPAWVRVVTLQGELFYASGPITAGHSGKTSTLSRPRQRRELGEQLASLQKQVAGASQKIDGFESALAQMRAQEGQLREALSGGQRQERAATEAHHQAVLGRDRARRQAQWQQEQRQKLEAEIEAGETEAREISGRIGQMTGGIREAQAMLRDQQAALAAISLEEFQDQLAHWSTLAAVAERALSDAKYRQQERSAALVEAAQNVQALQTRLGVLQDGFYGLGDKKEVLHAQDAEVVAKIEGLQQLIDPAEAELSVAEAEQEKLQGAESRARQALNMAERRYAQAQAMLARRQEGLDNLRERIEDDFGLVAFEYAEEISGPTPLPLSGMVEQLPMVSVLPEGLDETIKRQRLQLRRMGAINPEAQVEYREVNERFEFMTAQVADLHKAEADIREVIAELDVLMEREFRKTFDAVAVEFREIFTRLFGGGSARLVLTDPEDLTETGIDIEARLPGRRAQGLSLLSGGERSLTATALVFALLKVSPTPFCVLDEVDAMLDEANVGRFRDLLSELSQNTQFIVITHNRNTVQAAGVIYGVTMGRDSASQVISLKLDEVAEVV